MLAYTAVLAPILLVGADIIGRLVVRPGELSVGIVTAIIGAPVFIALVRRRAGGPAVTAIENKPPATAVRSAPCGSDSVSLRVTRRPLIVDRAVGDRGGRAP